MSWKKKSAVSQEKIKVQELLNDTDNRVDSWLETAERIIKFSEKAKTTYEANDDIQAKKIILSAIGSNLLLKDKKLSINTDSALLPMILVSSSVNQKSERLEPVGSSVNKGKTDAFTSVRPTWLRGQGSNLQPTP